MIPATTFAISVAAGADLAAGAAAWADCSSACCRCCSGARWAAGPSCCSACSPSSFSVPAPACSAPAAEAPTRWRKAAAHRRGLPATRRRRNSPATSSARRIRSGGSLSTAIASRRSISSPTKTGRAAARHRRRWARSTALRIKGSTSTPLSSTNWRAASAPPAMRRRPMSSRTKSVTTSRRRPAFRTRFARCRRDRRRPRAMRCRFAWSCRPTATPASGPIARGRRTVSR